MAPDARTAVYDMRIAGDAQGALAFSAWQQTVPALAWIVDAAELEQVLETAIRFAPAVATVDADAKAALTVIAEGKAAAAREKLGVAFERHAYGHSALAARVVSDVAACRRRAPVVPRAGRAGAAAVRPAAARVLVRHRLVDAAGRGRAARAGRATPSSTTR